MARTRPRLRGRAHVTTQLAGEVALAVVLGVTLALSWSDGTRNVDPFNALMSTSPGTAFTAVSGDNPYSGERPPRSRPNLVAPAPVARAVIPTAPPVQLFIPALDVHRAVEAVGTDRFGVMDLPANSWNAGWYRGGPVPGAPGDAVIEGHAGYPGQPMIFGKLVTLRPGDRVIVVLSDGSRYLFLVDSMSVVHIGTAPPGMAEPYGPPRLTLITCTGHFDKNSYSYSDRLVVEASYAGPV